MTDLTAAPEDAAGDTTPPDEVARRLEGYRGELTGYCYRMLGAASEADDAVQDTMVRAWRAIDRFEGRSSLRSWLYRIATNVCVDAANSRKRRALPLDLADSASPPVVESLGAAEPHESWVEPLPDQRVGPPPDDPADRVLAQESIRLAFVSALQRLPARQRAVLILREVLAWSAAEVAELLDTTVAGVNSALQRARATLAAQNADAAASTALDPLDAEHEELLGKYVDAFERYDIDVLVALLHRDATQSMPPYSLFLKGPADIAAWHLGPGLECEGSRLLRVMANGSPALAQYRRSKTGPGWEPWAIQTLEVREGQIASLTAFLDTRLFTAFGLPPRLEG